MKVESKFITIQSDINGVVLADYLDNAQVWTNNTVNIADTLSDVLVENLPELPQSGWVEKGLYKYNNSTVYCIQPHNRTIYTPDKTPALWNEVVIPVPDVKPPHGIQMIGASML